MHRKFHVRCRALIIDNEELMTVAHVGKSEWLVLPGGHLEAEEGIKTGLEREIVEELGVKPLVGPLLYVHEFVTEENIGVIEFIFLVLNGHDYRNLSDERSHAHEIAEIVWLPRTEAVTDKKFRPQPIYDQWLINGFANENKIEFI